VTYQQSVVRLRVHFVPIGYEVQRVVEPLVHLRADVALLLTKSITDRASSSLHKIELRSKEEGIQFQVIELNIWDTSVVIDQVGAVISSARNNDYFFNLSTGPKTTTIAGTIAAMLWPIKPYYSMVNYEGKTGLNQADFPVEGPPLFVPTFETPGLDKTTLETLEFIVFQPNPISKRELISSLKSKGAIRARQKVRVTPQALQAQTDVILRRLESWGFLAIEGRGKATKIQATEMGRAGAKMFHHVLYPRPLPTILSPAER